MKKVMLLLFACGVYGVSSAQTSGTVGTSTGSYPAYSNSCQTQVNTINASYDQQIAAYNADTRLTTYDRDYKILMTNFNRNAKLAQVEQSCGSTVHHYRSCLDQANAINRTYNNQVTVYRGNTSYTTADRNYKIEQTQAARNTKLRELLNTCTY